MEKILFNNYKISPGIRISKKLKTLLASVFSIENVPFKHISYVFCKDDYLLTLNQQYLQHGTLTDILTFVLSDKEEPLESEIYISVERVKENATDLNTNYKNELIRVMIHGILHLCGYDDHTAKQRRVMRKKEEYYLSMVGST